MGIGALSSVRSSVFRRSSRSPSLFMQPSSFLGGHSFLSRRCPRRSGIFMPWEHLSADRIFAELSALPVPALLVRSSGIPVFRGASAFQCSGAPASHFRRPCRHQTRRSPQRLRFSDSLHRIGAGSQPRPLYAFTASLTVRRFWCSRSTVGPRSLSIHRFALGLRSSAVHRIGSPASLLLAARCRPYFPASQRTTACTSRFVRKPPCAALPILRPRKGIEPTRR